MSWAARVADGAPAVEAAREHELQGKRVAVVDANAIISKGATVRALGDVVISTEEVLAEVKDAVAREAMAHIPFECRVPSQQALKAVAAFAKQTGDLYQLSLEDLRLLAVAYTLEQQLHGTEHLRTAPVPVRARAKRSDKAELPGWGNVQSEEWSAIDAVRDDGVHICSDIVILCAMLSVCQACSGRVPAGQSGSATRTHMHHTQW